MARTIEEVVTVASGPALRLAQASPVGPAASMVRLNVIGVKVIGEIGIVAAPAAIANAVFHATGKRIRELPISSDKPL